MSDRLRGNKEKLLSHSTRNKCVQNENHGMSFPAPIAETTGKLAIDRCYFDVTNLIYSAARTQ